MSDREDAARSLLLSLQSWKGRCLQVEEILAPARPGDRHQQLRTSFLMTLSEALPLTSGCKLLLLGQGSVQLECFLDRIDQIEQSEIQISWCENLGQQWIRRLSLKLEGV